MKIETQTERLEIAQIYAIRMEYGEWRFDLIYGKYNDDWFMAVPNWKIATGLYEPDRAKHNARKINLMGISFEESEAIAKTIKEDYESRKGERA